MSAHPNCDGVGGPRRCPLCELLNDAAVSGGSVIAVGKGDTLEAALESAFEALIEKIDERIGFELERAAERDIERKRQEKAGEN